MAEPQWDRGWRAELGRRIAPDRALARHDRLELMYEKLEAGLTAVSFLHGEEAPVGVMLHHALVDDEERERIGELLELLSSHWQVHCRLMRDLVPSFERIATS